MRVSSDAERLPSVGEGMFDWAGGEQAEMGESDRDDMRPPRDALKPFRPCGSRCDANEDRPGKPVRLLSGGNRNGLVAGGNLWLPLSSCS